jgi:glycine betaine/proline transport system ATP-binding protein
VLEQVGLKTFAGKKPAELSGGMQQRVGLARALAVDPSLMLMDEAFSALDPLKRTEMQELLLQLQAEQQRTIVFVSHDLDEAFRIGDRIAIMEGGRIVQIGTPDEILRNPSDAYVRAFFKGVDVRKYLVARDVARQDAAPLIQPGADGPAGLCAAIEQLRLGGGHGFVVDATGRLLGAVSADSLLQAQASSEPSLQQALLPDEPSVPATLSLHQLVARVVRRPVPLAVVDDDGAYLGAVTQTILLQQYAAHEVDHG